MKLLTQFGIEYVEIPGPRGQDIVDTRQIGTVRIIGVLDGWNNEQFLPGNESGRKAAEFVLANFPKEYLMQKGSLRKRAQKTTEIVDLQLLRQIPAHASCVATFLFISKTLVEIVSVGDVHVFLWDGQVWYIPKEIGDYSLPYPEYPSDGRIFFGRGELKGNPFYAIKADFLTCPPSAPILIATDGIDDVLSLEDINTIAQIAPEDKLLETILYEIQKRGTQKDDISILLRWPLAQ